MDDYLDPYLSSLSWSDVNVKEKSSWLHGEPDESNVLLPNPLGLYQEAEKVPPMGCLAAQDTPSTVPSGDSECAIDDGFLSVETEQQIDSQNCSSNSMNEILNGYDTALHTAVHMNFCSPKQLPLVGDMRSSLSFLELGHNGFHSAKFRRSLPDLQNLSPNSQMLWPSASYDCYSSPSTLMGHNGPQGNNDSYVEMDKLLQLETMSASMNSKGKQEVQNCSFPSFAARPEMTMTVASPSAAQNASIASNGTCNGIGKPRVRARRGQATDPHSIAERLRREKIADRMKSLQELVPNSNKTDKASMLDEIIEYVKFLQLQVKVLSMSRLGAAGAVAPLITDGQAEGSNGLLLSHLANQGADFSLSPDQIAFEQEIVKLMESDITMAMQYLQTKGLCLMPVALADAMSKPSPSVSASGETKVFNIRKSGNSCSSSNSSVSIGAHQKPSNVKQEEISTTFSTKG